MNGKKPQDQNGKAVAPARRAPQVWLRMHLDRLNDPAVVEAVKTALLRVSGVKEVVVDSHAHTVTVRGENLNGSKLTATAKTALKARGSPDPAGRC